MDNFKKYIFLLMEENKKINLTSYRSESEIFTKLIRPSVNLGTVLALPSQARIIDIGSGPGIPGIPLAIQLQENAVVLVESIKKKAEFLEKVRVDLDLRNLKIISARAEVLGKHPDFRGCFDISVCRAIGGLGVSLELLAPFCMIGGKVIIFRGMNEKVVPAYEEIKSELGLEFSDILKDIYEGKVWIFNKTGETKGSYPRKPGIPEKRERFIKEE